MADVGRRLSRLTPRNNSMRVNEAESIDDYFSLHRLDRIDDYCNRSNVQLFERLNKKLSDPGKKSRMDGADLLSINIYT